MSILNGTAGADSLSGGLDADIIYGLDGADTITGGGGADTLFGGEGDDLLIVTAGAGSSVVGMIDGGPGSDTWTSPSSPARSPPPRPRRWSSTSAASGSMWPMSRPS